MAGTPKMSTWRYRRDKRSLYKQRIAGMISSRDYFSRLKRLRGKYLEFLKNSDNQTCSLKK